MVGQVNNSSAITTGLHPANMNLLVYYLNPPDDGSLDLLRAHIPPELELVTGAGADIPPDTQILIAGRPKQEQIRGIESLETLIVPWAGIPPETRDLMLQFPQIPVHNLHHNAGPVAEMVLALLLSAAKWIVPMDRSLRAFDWTPRYQAAPSILIAGKTALILGYGAIGRKVAQLVKGFDLEILAIRNDPNASSDGLADEIHGPASLTRLLPRAAILIICLPHTPETDGLIGKKELDLLPENSLLVNVGRGPIVDEAALYYALRDGHLAAAGLDVWYNYPSEPAARPNTAPASYPFHVLDNVVFSPHRAGSVRQSNRLRMEHLARLLNAAAHGEPLDNSVDIKSGY